jgi:hypothetical protein
MEKSEIEFVTKYCRIDEIEDRLLPKSMKPKITRELGTIGSTELGFEDHGIFTFYLHFTFKGSGQGFGGYFLDNNEDKDPVTISATWANCLATGMAMISEIIQICEVSKWEELKGKQMWVIRKDRNSGGWNGLIKGIQHPKTGKIFDIEEFTTKWSVLAGRIQ